MVLLLVTGDALTEALKRATTSPDAHVRAAAARALGDTGDRSAMTQLITLLRDDNDIVSAAAAEALGKLGADSVMTEFIEVLTQPSADTNAAPGLVVGTESPTLKEFAAMKQEERLTAAIRVLGRSHNPRAVQPLLDHGLKSDAMGVRIAAAIALGRLKDRRAVAPLVELLQTYYDLRDKLKSGPIFEKTPSPAEQHLKESEAYLRAAIVWALGEICDSGALPALKRAVDDDNSLVRDAAKEALDKLGSVTLSPRR